MAYEGRFAVGLPVAISPSPHLLCTRSLASASSKTLYYATFILSLLSYHMYYIVLDKLDISYIKFHELAGSRRSSQKRKNGYTFRCVEFS